MVKQRITKLSPYQMAMNAEFEKRDKYADHLVKTQGLHPYHAMSLANIGVRRNYSLLAKEAFQVIPLRMR